MTTVLCLRSSAQTRDISSPTARIPVDTARQTPDRTGQAAAGGDRPKAGDKVDLRDSCGEQPAFVFDCSDPAEMRTELESLLHGFKAAGPGGIIRDNTNCLGSKRHEAHLAHAEAFT